MNFISYFNETYALLYSIKIKENKLGITGRQVGGSEKKSEIKKQLILFFKHQKLHTLLPKIDYQKVKVYTSNQTHGILAENQISLNFDTLRIHGKNWSCQTL